MPLPIFYSKKLSTWDKITMSGYFVVLLGLWYFYKNSTSFTIQKNITFWIGPATQFFLYAVNYKSLRNLKVYAYWVFISLIHLYVYFQLKTDSKLVGIAGHFANPLRNTLPLLFLFQILRFISAKTQGLELVSIFENSTTDLFDDRKKTLIDFILFFVYFGATFFLVTVD